jgi:hypothetical protein
MLIDDQISERTRLQCASCGAHALVKPEDYAELRAQSDNWMRCEVCGVHGRFEPTRRAEPAPRPLTLHH